MSVILVVDDEFGIAEVLEALLLDVGYQVVTAMNGRQGLDRMHDMLPDLILLDVMMPVMDGPAMVRAVKAHPDYVQIPIVLMSSLPEPVVLEAAGDHHAAFLRKPFKVGDVVDVLQRVLTPRPA